MAKKLKEVVEQLKGAVVAHGKQAKVIENHIKEMKGGASMLGQLREKQSQDKANIEESKVKAQNSIIPEPSSNGTGSARPNFNMFAQNAISGVMNGQQMGNMLFGQQQQPQAPNMPPVDPMTQNNPDMGMMGGSMKGIDPPKKIKRIKPVGQNVGEGGSQGFINAFAGSNQNESKSLARGTRAEVKKNKKKIKRGLR